jgi:hypothetical protein
MRAGVGSSVVERRFELVEEAFAEVVRTQPGTGATVAVWLEVAGWSTCGAGPRTP